MATMNISLPDKLKEWVEAQVATGRYANVSDLVRDLVRRAQDRDLPQFSAFDTAAIERALVARERDAEFVSHAQAMDELDAAIEATARRKRA